MRSAVLVLMGSVALGGCGDSAKQQAAAPEKAVAAEAATPVQAPPPPAPVAETSASMMSKEDLAKQICFLTPDEIKTAFGREVAAGVAKTAQLASGTVSCGYDGKELDLDINAIWLDPAGVAQSKAMLSSLWGGTLEKIAGDPDEATMQYQPDLGGALHYVRGNIMIEVRPTHWTTNEEMKKKLLSLRRVP